VDRIALNADAGTPSPKQITTSGQQVVQLDWSGRGLGGLASP
jgi:hypothetical protein